MLDSARAVRQQDVALPLPRELNKSVTPPYIVEPGDVLLVLTPEQDTADASAADKNRPTPIHIPADQPVLPDGTIDLGQYGRLLVAGKTADQIEGAIRGVVQAQLQRDPGFIDVRIIVRDSKVYYVLGEVNSPGAFALKGRETALDGIIAAGGLNDRASRNNIILAQPTPPDSCRIVLPICYSEIVQLGDTTTNYQIQPGDRIYVPARTFAEVCGCNKCRICEHAQTACPILPPSGEHDCHEPAMPPPIQPPREPQFFSQVGESK
jgi:protein involved in polysaccharide export with SLBB domain